MGKPTPWPGAASGDTSGAWLVLAVADCCRNLGGAEVLVDARIELGSTTRGVGIAGGCASIPSMESGTTGFGTGMSVSGGGAASAVSSSWGVIDVSSLETEVPGGLVPDSGRVVPAKGWESPMAGVSCWISVGLLESEPSDESCRS